jgi:malate dehydrogenase
MVKILITGACGQIAYSLLPLICSGHMFGDLPIELNLLDIPMMRDKLKGIEMEIMDSCFPSIISIESFTDPVEATKNVDYAILLGGFPRKPGMERNDLIEKNVNIFRTIGESLNTCASKDIRIIVVANPANTNCLVCSDNAPNISKSSFTCLTMLDHDRLMVQLFDKLKKDSLLDQNDDFNITCIRNVTIWGNHSSTMVPDITNAELYIDNRWTRLTDINELSHVITDDWINGELVPTVRNRGSEIIKSRQLSSAMSAAQSIVRHIRYLHFGTTSGETVSMGIHNDGLFYSKPVSVINGQTTFDENMKIDTKIQNQINHSIDELNYEKTIANNILLNINL